MLARTVSRTKEIAIRTALGAGRLRTISQLLAETLVLAVAGATVGLLVAKAGIDFFNASAANQELPFWLVVGFDPAVIVFVFGLTVLSAILAGTIPALRASTGEVSEILNDEARGSSGLRLGRISKVLVIAQLAFSCGLLVAAGLMIRTIVNVSRFDYGFNTATHSSRGVRIETPRRVGQVAAADDVVLLKDGVRLVPGQLRFARRLTARVAFASTHRASSARR